MRAIRSLDHTKTIENQARKLAPSVLTQNQLDLILKKKKRVCWSREEVSKAFTLRYFSKRAYSYVKDELLYPIPGKKNNIFNILYNFFSQSIYVIGLSCLPWWAKTIGMKNGVLHNVLQIMKLNGET